MSEAVATPPWRTIDFDCPSCRAEFGQPCRSRGGSDLNGYHESRQALKRPAPCGTLAAYHQHKRDGESVDEACREASAEYMREWRAEKSEAARRMYATNRARDRAKQRVAEMYPDDFQRLFEEEKAAIK